MSDLLSDALPFPKLLKINNNSYYFWANIFNHSYQTQVYLGTVDVNSESNQNVITSQIINDLFLKCDTNKIYLKLFHDQTSKGRDVIHFLLLVDNDQNDNLKRSLLYATSKMLDVTNEINRHREQIDHYLEHSDYYGYHTVKKYSI